MKNMIGVWHFLYIASAIAVTNGNETISDEDDDMFHEDHDDHEDWFTSTYNISFISNVFGKVQYCAKWGPANHMYFQLANTFFFLSYLAPNGTYGILYLRCTLLVGCALFALWGWTVLCSLDAFLWNANFVLINFVHVCILLYYLRPVKFSREIEEALKKRTFIFDKSVQGCNEVSDTAALQFVQSGNPSRCTVFLDGMKEFKPNFVVPYQADRQQFLLPILKGCLKNVHNGHSETYQNPITVHKQGEMRFV